MSAETQLITIDDQLRLILFGLECALDVEFPVEVAEKVWSDGEEDGVTEKRYTLWTGPRLRVTGIVEEYEPGDIWLTVKSAKPFSPALLTIRERAKYQAYRLDKPHD